MKQNNGKCKVKTNKDKNYELYSKTTLKFRIKSKKRFSEKRGVRVRENINQEFT